MTDPNGLSGVTDPGHAPMQQGASAAPIPQPPLQGMMQVHQGMQYGGPQPSMYQTPQYMPIPQHQQNDQLRQFWLQQNREVQEVGTDPAEFKNHQLPLARIKKIMKSDEDVRMISAEAPVLFAKACEMFILELTLRSWNHSEENKRRTLQRNDIAAAITRTDIFDFLVDIVPREERDEGALRPGQPMPPMPSMPMPSPMGYWPQGQPGPMHPGAEQQQQRQQPPLSTQLQQPQQPQQYPQIMPMAPRPPGMQMDQSMMQAYYMQQQQQQHHAAQQQHPQQQQQPEQQQQPQLQQAQGQWQHLPHQQMPLHMPPFDSKPSDGQTTGQ